MQTLKSKLTSRKLWAAIVGFVSSIMFAAGAPPDSIAQVAAIITAGGVLIGYMIGQGLADSAEIIIENAEISDGEKSDEADGQ